MYDMVGPVSIKYIFTTRYIGLYITLFPNTILPYKFWVPVSVSIFHHLCTDLIYAVLVCDDFKLSPNTNLPYSLWGPVSISISYNLCTNLLYAVMVCGDYILRYLLIQIGPIRYGGLCL